MQNKRTKSKTLKPLLTIDQLKIQDFEIDPKNKRRKTEIWKWEIESIVQNECLKRNLEHDIHMHINIKD